jgi:calcineurin-like phosphoesterase family protein
MAGNIFAISDTHWNHANILNFTCSETGSPTRPGFADVEAMNEHMIERWNSVVKPGDKVYHLGDVVFGENKEDWMAKNFPRLNGKKRLIVGNHDNIKFHAAGGWWGKIDLWRMFPEFGLLLTHVPVHERTLGESRFTGKKMLNVHGHIHTNKSPSEDYRCVCVEQINYTPVSLEELRVV